jgi:hypothetical protein
MIAWPNSFHCSTVCCFYRRRARAGNRLRHRICRAVKPSAEPVAAAEAPNGEAAIDPAYRIAAE